ncbi:haloacid dehalogenase-like hydrolase [Collimonas silvisoli]|uniref:haloacid dehalogenase-like hydrolase n=1 Tax=Collimonas silvisoli TaxID=2825884 RepID=UPI001B8D1B64|nr:HAD family hydrolase [Collimonas silvisoli]
MKSVKKPEDKTMLQKRRTLLTGGLAAGLAATALPTELLAKDSKSAGLSLDRAKWGERNHRQLQALLARNGKSSAGYNPRRRPYAVFDWDNTSIMNDTEEALLMYQINTLSFKLSPQELGAIIRQNVPAGPFAASFKNAAGKAVELEDICADIDDDYQYLYDNYEKLKGNKKLEEIRETTQFQDFRAKLYYLYEAVNETYGVNVGYPWVIYFFTNMSVAEVQQLAEASNDHNLGLGLVKTKYTSPAALPGKAGIVNVTHFHGIRLCTEIATLMDAFQQSGIDVYVSSASLEDVVAVFATTPKYGYNVKREHVLGLRLETANGAFVNKYKAGWPLNWGPGKTEVIKQELVAAKGYGPIFVAGDSDGDYDMLRDFADTQLGMIVNRMKKGKIGDLSKLAADQIPAKSPRFLLQGRNETTGNWMPSEASIKYGKTGETLLG